jgi:hypothetical protein
MTPRDVAGALGGVFLIVVLGYWVRLLWASTRGRTRPTDLNETPFSSETFPGPDFAEHDQSSDLGHGGGAL